MGVTITQGGAMSEAEHTQTNDGLRVGVIGYGQRAEIAQHVAQAGVGARVVAIADTTEAGRARAAAAYPDAVIEQDHTALIAGHHLDAAIVTTPDWTHADIAEDLLRAGVAVYLEKPLAITVSVATASTRSASSTVIASGFSR
jgi:predicted dehydrogenase